MRQAASTALLVLIAAAGPGTPAAQAGWETKMDGLVGKHPHDLIRPEQVAPFRAAFGKRHPRLVKRFADLRKKFDRTLEPEMGRHRNGAERLRISRVIYGMGGDMESFAQAYLATSNPDFGHQARRILLHLARWSPDAGGGLKGQDEVPMKIMELCPRVYDWIHDLLSEEERGLVRTSMLARGKLMWKRVGSGKRIPSDSHGGRMLGFMGEAGVVFYGEFPEAREWLTGMVDLIARRYPRWGGADGGWSEGPSYWAFYQGKMVLFLWSHYAATGSKTLLDKAFFHNNAYYGLYCTPLGLRLRSFGDGAADRYAHPDRPLYRTSERFIARFHGTAHGNGHFMWYGDQAKTPPWGSGWGFYEALMDNLKQVPAVEPGDLPQSRCFHDIGWAAMHSRLAKADQDVFLLFKSSPYGSASHSHADQNGFSLSAYDKALAIPSGYYKNPGATYGCPHHVRWTRQTLANNCVLVDGKGQRERGGKARIELFSTDGTGAGITYARGNARDCYAVKLSRAIRHCVKLDGATFILMDEVTAPKPSKFSWLLHALEKMKVSSSGTSAALVLSRPPARCHARVLCSLPVSASQTDRFGTPPTVGKGKKPPPNQWHARVDTLGESKRCMFVSRLTVSRSDQATPRYEGTALTEGTGFAAASWRRGRTRTALLVRGQAAGGVEHERLALNGVLGLVRSTANDAERWLLVEGTALTLADHTLVKASTPVTVSVTSTSGGGLAVGLGSGEKGARITLATTVSATRARFRAERSEEWKDLPIKAAAGKMEFTHPGRPGELIVGKR